MDGGTLKHKAGMFCVWHVWQVCPRHKLVGHDSSLIHV